MGRPFWNFTFFFFNDTAPTEIYTLSLHDALPIYVAPSKSDMRPPVQAVDVWLLSVRWRRDLTPPRLSSRHSDSAMPLLVFVTQVQVMVSETIRMPLPPSVPSL